MGELNYTKGEWSANKTTTFEGEEIYAIRTYPEPTRIQRVADVFLEANAQLISAAPDLYETGKKLVNWLHRLADNAEQKAKVERFITLKEALEADVKNYRATVRDMEQALAKAEGK